MSIIYKQGLVTKETFEKTCESEGINPFELVFIFPGNASHHGSDNTLFSIKNGGGLAAAAKELGEEGYPTLSLPTTSMDGWESSQEQKKTVEGAIADLYRAMGAGFHLMFPVRKHENQHFFDKALPFSKDELEPNFWNGIQKCPNKPLANFYINELNKLHEFALLPHNEQIKQAENNKSQPSMASFLAGNVIHKSDAWLKPAREAKTINPAVSGWPKSSNSR